MLDKEKHVNDWITRGNDDFLTAQISFRGNAPYGSIILLIQQAAEKYLKGYLLSKGWALKKTHDLIELTDEAIGFDASFEIYLELARHLTAYYFETRYPPGPVSDYSKEEMTGLLDNTAQLINKIKDTLK